MSRPYNDRARRNGSKTDWLSILAVVAGLVALVTFLLYLGVIADAVIGLLELS